jgi:uroporphyrin-III C-methyltransferase
VSRIDEMAADIARAGLSSPAVIVIGEAVTLIDAAARGASMSRAA